VLEGSAAPLFFVPGAGVAGSMCPMFAQPIPCRLALVGLMGAGKTRVGRLVASALGWPFHDADLLVEWGAGRSVPAVFSEEGEAGFRRRESAVLAELAGREPPLVVATGGGVVERAGNRRLLAESFRVVWLRIAPEEAARRLAGGRGRPLLAESDPVEVLRSLAATREALYAEVAGLTLRTGPETRPEDLRDEILAVVEEE
jgi:shikimate kinase